jgi:predicted NBD/HSP70 family sugar kinase
LLAAIAVTCLVCLGLSFCPGVSTPNSLQNDTSVPVGGDVEEELSLPVFLDADASLDSDDDELVRPIAIPF